MIVSLNKLLKRRKRSSDAVEKRLLLYTYKLHTKKMKTSIKWALSFDPNGAHIREVSLSIRKNRKKGMSATQ